MSSRHEIREFLRLIREGLATPEVVAELHRLIAHDREARQDYVRMMHFQASLCWLLDGCVPGDDAVQSAVRQYRQRRFRMWLWRSATALVALSVLIISGAWSYATWGVREVTVVPVVGQVTAQYGEKSSAGMPLRIGQQWTMPTGVAELWIGKGAQVAIEGPAALRIESADRVVLERGKLLADVPPSAAGFTVGTRSAQAVDLGTQFGVVIDPNGAAEFHVLQGQIRAQSERLSSELLHADQASRYSTDGQQRQSMPAERDAFNACLQMKAGIVELTGEARFCAQPGDALDAAGHARPDVIQVFQERHGFRLPADLDVITVDDGVLEPATAPTRDVLLADTPVDVYVAHLQTTGSALRRCRVKFARPVAGVLIESDALDQTDAWFAAPQFPYLPPEHNGVNRGAIYTPSGASKTQDRLSLSEDRLTITIQFEAQKTDIDQVRLIVPAESK
jgi:ferric-dicitrate binding protein FerR (iron transport regulator)